MDLEYIGVRYGSSVINWVVCVDKRYVMKLIWYVMFSYCSCLEEFELVRY